MQFDSRIIAEISKHLQSQSLVTVPSHWIGLSTGRGLVKEEKFRVEPLTVMERDYNVRSFLSSL